MKRLDSYDVIGPIEIELNSREIREHERMILSAYLFTSVGLFEGEPEGATVGAIGLMG